MIATTSLTGGEGGRRPCIGRVLLQDHTGSKREGSNWSTTISAIMSGSAFTRADHHTTPIIMVPEGDRFIQTPVHDLTTVSSYRRRILTRHITVRQRYLRYVSTDHDGVEEKKIKN
jgi:hypothetical protein